MLRALFKNIQEDPQVCILWYDTLAYADSVKLFLDTQAPT